MEVKPFALTRNNFLNLSIFIIRIQEIWFIDVKAKYEKSNFKIFSADNK